jgi:glycosyltransferase involved in cell wall biosynthesis
VTGFLVPVDDAGVLAERLVRLLSDDSLRTTMGRKSLDRVKRLFDVPVHDHKWLAAYTSLLSRNQRNAAETGALFSE